MNVALFFTEPLLNDDGVVIKVQTPAGEMPSISCMGCYFFNVPTEQLSAFQAKVVAEGGKLEIESKENLHYRFHGKHTCVLVNSLAFPFMYQN